MILLITTQEQEQTINNTIHTVDRLDELITVTTYQNDEITGLQILHVNKDNITVGIDWHDERAPYILPEIPYSDKNLLACIFLLLDNFENALSYLEKDSSLYNHFLLIYHIQSGLPLTKELIKFMQQTSLHNQCIIHHLRPLNGRLPFLELNNKYIKALNSTKNIEYKVFTAKYYLHWLEDHSKFDEALQLIHALKKNKLSKAAENNMNISLAASLKRQLKIPYDNNKLSQIIALLKGAITYFESRKITVQLGLTLLDISEIENLKKDFSAAKKHIDKSIYLLKNEDLKEYLGEAFRQKARILHQWSKHGQPQYFKSTINALHNALKIFKQADYPQQFADVHHQLALLYSEIPGSSEEKVLWSAFCASSFNSVLAFYSKDKYPYEYARACHNYATALLQFPEIRQQSNLEKAKNLFEEALSVRSKEQYPIERALTLMNQLELYWLQDIEKSNVQEHYLAMMLKVEELKTLTDDKRILKQVVKHEERLQQLKSLL